MKVNNKEMTSLIADFKKFEVVSDITLSFVILYFATQFVRAIGKNLFEKRYFKDEFNMPTTIFLTYSNNEYSDDYKKKFAAKVKRDFKLQLKTKDAELTDLLIAKQHIIEAFSHIRKKIGKNTFVLQHNVEYGAMRNAIGGSVLGILFSISNIFVFYWINYNQIAVIVSIIMFSIYFTLVVLSKPIILNYGRAYAKILIREYMTDELNDEK